MLKVRSFKPKQFKHFEMTKNAGGGVLRLISLGGVGNVTRNMYVYEYGEDIVIIDCGVGFPDEGMLGVDLIIPDINYLRDKKHKIRGIVISHGHEDHIGGLPYIWPQLDVPIYAQKLACGLIRSKFAEHKLPKDKINTMSLADNLKLGVFDISFYQVAHSIPDSVGIILRTPVGTLVHQADFKMDWTPVCGQVTDVAKIAQVGSSGVLFMTIDSLRVERQGFNPSEQPIQNSFSEIEKKTSGKLMITMTSSNFSRVQQAINVAVESGRKLALSGRSMENSFQVARDLGYLEVPANLVVPQEEIKRFPDNKIMILIAGSQGQPDSALFRVANHDHKYIQVKKNDAVILSADPIPSSESAQLALLDSFAKLGIDVYWSAVQENLHVTGHASREELKMVLNLIKPKYILPVGGTYRHMWAFSKMAMELGYKSDQVLLPKEGQIIEINHGQVRLNGHADAFNVYVDGLGVGDVGSVVLRDRQTMAEEGVVIVVVPTDPQTGKVLGEPDIISRGFVFEKQAEDLLEAAKEIVKSCLKDIPAGAVDWRYTRRSIEDSLKRFFYEETKRSPMILPVIVEL